MRSSFLPLVRLRGCILHPHAEIAVASKGGVPGRGAAEALESAGTAGSVLVAFESTDGVLHGMGVLARVQRVEHTSYGPRYVLRGVTRALIDESKIREGEPPRIAAELLPERADDLAQPPATLVATVGELASEWMGLDEWKDSFALLSRSRLGQWATTLCVLMPLDEAERLDLFDFPEQLGDRLQAKLERLLAVHSRRRIREAVLRESGPREPREVAETIVAVPPSSSLFLLFHPQDLAHRFGEGPEWWRDPAMVRQDLENGSLLGVDTESDEHLQVRITAGPLRAGEREAAAGEATFRMDVRRGRLFLGSPRNLPSRVTDLFQRELAVAEAWIDVPRGCWQVTVHAISRADAGAVEDDELGRVHAPADYVLRFQPVLLLTDVPPADSLARLPSRRRPWVTADGPS